MKSPEVTSCKVCAELYGLRYVPVEDYYSYVCTTLPRRARKPLLRRMVDWLRAAVTR